jgi:hypothetical protein
VTEFSRLAKIACGLGAATALLWCGSCARRDVSDLQPATEQQKILAAKAIEQLRVVFSAGACQSIYDNAAKAFRSQTEEDWLYQCDRLRKTLGEWRSFSVRSLETYQSTPAKRNSNQLLLIEVSAQFSKTTRTLGMTWTLNADAMQLTSLTLEERGEWIQIPARGGKLTDPPPPFRPGAHGRKMV